MASGDVSQLADALSRTHVRDEEASDDVSQHADVPNTHVKDEEASDDVSQHTDVPNTHVRDEESSDDASQHADVPNTHVRDEEASDDVSQHTDVPNTHVRDEDKELSFKGLKLNLDNAETVKELVHKIEQYQDLRALCLEGNTIGVEAAQAIAGALKQKDQLKRCYWSDIFTRRKRSEIPPALRSLAGAVMSAEARLTELDLSDNAFGPDGVKGIEKLLKSPTCYSLEKLRLNNCGMGIEGGKILAAALTECHKHSSDQGTPLTLKVFMAGRNLLKNEGATALATVFQLIGSLEEVHLPQNSITHPGITALALAIQSNPELRVLNLNDNTFSKKGALAMAQVLGHLKNVQVINFGDCLVRSEGAIAISAVLREGLPKLKELDLAFGQITDKAALVVAQAVADKPHMEKVDLNGNCLGEEGSETLKEFMKSMHKEHMLASLSDDEGEPDENDEENENEEEDNVEKGDQNEKENGTSNGETLPTKSPGSAEVEFFLNSPSSDTFLQLGEEKRTLLIQQVDLSDPDKAADILLKISSIYSEQPETKRVVLETVNGMFKRLFSGSTLQSYCFLSSLLVRMGFLKGEGKARKLHVVPGHLRCLEHAIQQEYFPQDHVSLLQTFLCKNDKVLKSGGTAHNLWTPGEKVLSRMVGLSTSPTVSTTASAKPPNTQFTLPMDTLNKAMEGLLLDNGQGT